MDPIDIPLSVPVSIPFAERPSNVADSVDDRVLQGVNNIADTQGSSAAALAIQQANRVDRIAPALTSMPTAAVAATGAVAVTAAAQVATQEAVPLAPTAIDDATALRSRGSGHGKKTRRSRANDTVHDGGRGENIPLGGSLARMDHVTAAAAAAASTGNGFASPPQLASPFCTTRRRREPRQHTGPRREFDRHRSRRTAAVAAALGGEGCGGHGRKMHCPPHICRRHRGRTSLRSSQAHGTAVFVAPLTTAMLAVIATQTFPPALPPATESLCNRDCELDHVHLFPRAGAVFGSGERDAMLTPIATETAAAQERWTGSTPLCRLASGGSAAVTTDSCSLPSPSSMMQAVARYTTPADAALAPPTQQPPLQPYVPEEGAEESEYARVWQLQEDQPHAVGMASEVVPMAMTNTPTTAPPTLGSTTPERSLLSSSESTQYEEKAVTAFGVEADTYATHIHVHGPPSSSPWQTHKHTQPPLGTSESLSSVPDLPHFASASATSMLMRGGGATTTECGAARPQPFPNATPATAGRATAAHPNAETVATHTRFLFPAEAPTLAGLTRFPEQNPIGSTEPPAAAVSPAQEILSTSHAEVPPVPPAAIFASHAAHFSPDSELHTPFSCAHSPRNGGGLMNSLCSRSPSLSTVRDRDTASSSFTPSAEYLGRSNRPANPVDSSCMMSASTTATTTNSKLRQILHYPHVQASHSQSDSQACSPFHGTATISTTGGESVIHYDPRDSYNYWPHYYRHRDSGSNGSGWDSGSSVVVHSYHRTYSSVASEDVRRTLAQGMFIGSGGIVPFPVNSDVVDRRNDVDNRDDNESNSRDSRGPHRRNLSRHPRSSLPRMHSVLLQAGSPYHDPHYGKNGCVDPQAMLWRAAHRNSDPLSISLVDRLSAAPRRCRSDPLVHVRGLGTVASHAATTTSVGAGTGSGSGRNLTKRPATALAVGPKATSVVYRIRYGSSFRSAAPSSPSMGSGAFGFHTITGHAEAYASSFIAAVEATGAEEEGEERSPAPAAAQEAEVVPLFHTLPMPDKGRRPSISWPISESHASTYSTSNGNAFSLSETQRQHLRELWNTLANAPHGYPAPHGHGDADASEGPGEGPMGSFVASASSRAGAVPHVLQSELSIHPLRGHRQGGGRGGESNGHRQIPCQAHRWLSLRPHLPVHRNDSNTPRSLASCPSPLRGGSVALNGFLMPASSTPAAMLLMAAARRGDAFVSSQTSSAVIVAGGHRVLARTAGDSASCRAACGVYTRERHQRSRAGACFGPGDSHITDGSHASAPMEAGEAGLSRVGIAHAGDLISESGSDETQQLLRRSSLGPSSPPPPFAHLLPLSRTTGEGTSTMSTSEASVVGHRSPRAQQRGGALPTTAPITVMCHQSNDSDMLVQITSPLQQPSSPDVVAQLPILDPFLFLDGNRSEAPLTIVTAAPLVAESDAALPSGAGAARQEESFSTCAAHMATEMPAAAAAATAFDRRGRRECSRCAAASYTGVAVSSHGDDGGTIPSPGTHPETALAGALVGDDREGSQTHLNASFRHAHLALSTSPRFASVSGASQSNESESQGLSPIQRRSHHYRQQDMGSRQCDRCDPTHSSDAAQSCHSTRWPYGTADADAPSRTDVEFGANGARVSPMGTDARTRTRTLTNTATRSSRRFSCSDHTAGGGGETATWPVPVFVPPVDVDALLGAAESRLRQEPVQIIPVLGRSSSRIHCQWLATQPSHSSPLDNAEQEGVDGASDAPMSRHRTPHGDNSGPLLQEPYPRGSSAERSLPGVHPSGDDGAVSSQTHRSILLSVSRGLGSSMTSTSTFAGVSSNRREHSDAPSNETTQTISSFGNG